MNEQPAHYRLAPSSASRWLHCPGSARDDLPDTSNEAAERGTLAHELATSMLAYDLTPAHLYTALARLPEEEQDSILAAVTAYVDFARAQREALGADMLIERKWVSQMIPEHGGTIDCLLVSPTTLMVIDFKYGTMPVRAPANPQLACYLNLAREHFSGREQFRAAIAQPRVGEEPVEETEFTELHLDRIRLAVVESSVDDTLCAGGHCRWCPLLLECAEAERALIAAAEEDFTVIPAPLPEEDKARLVALMELGPVAQAAAEAARLQLLNELTNGYEVPGYKAVRTFRKRKWKDPDEALLTLTLKFPQLASRFSTSEIVSPAKVEKLIHAAELRKLDLVDRPEGGYTIAPQTSPLPLLSFDDFEVLADTVD